MEERIEDTWYHKQHKKNEEEHRQFTLAKERSLMYGMSMSLSDIGSVRTLTYDQCEQIKHTGDIVNDHKYKRKKLILTTKEAK